MPQVGFICPDNGVVKHEDCLKKCRMNKRCACYTTLYGMSEVRTWSGKPSVTMLLKGLREVYLGIIHDYYVSPQQLMYSMHGRAVHMWKEYYGRKLGLIVEKAHPDSEITGILDLLVPAENSPGEYDLIDYKTWGSYTVKKVLGYYQEDVPTGEFYKRDGKTAKKGDPKTKKEWFQSDDQVDWSNADMQLNKYRLMCEAEGYKIRKMFVEINVRDGGLLVAITRNTENNIYYLEVPFIPDDVVNEFFDTRRKALLDALETRQLPEVCSERERWDDNKCRKSCNVWMYCDHGKSVREGEPKGDE